MERPNPPSRSRFGCSTCRRRHRKCDEKRPICTPCQSRGLECGFELTLKWTRVNNINSFGATNHQKNASSKSTDGSTSRRYLASPLSTQRPSLGGSLSPNHQVQVPSAPQPNEPQVEASLSGSFEAAEEIESCLDQNDNGFSAIDDDEGSNAQAWSRWQEVSQTNDFSAQQNVQSDHNNAEPRAWPERASQRSISHSFERGSDDIHEDSTIVLDDTSPSYSGSWVIDDKIDGHLIHFFSDPGENIAFSYFLNRVSACIPALDSVQNPYRKLALVALSCPVLLDGILSVSTAHMFNYGRSHESVRSLRQARALKSLQLALHALQRDTNLDEPSDSHGIFSILSTREVALAAIMMQTSSVLMTGIGNVEIHLKCALHLIRDLNFVHRLPKSIFSRILLYRFVMVDVVLAHLRFRHPMSPTDFCILQCNEDLDKAEPSFREMQGCCQRVLYFLARIAALAADTMTCDNLDAHIQAKAYSLETEMRVWGQRYHDAMMHEDVNSAWEFSPTNSSMSRTGGNSGSDDLEIVCECFYWTAHILLMRRVFLDTTKSARVQVVRRRMFRLMDRLNPGCGPDSSLPFPFYIAAREATTLQDRDWVRRKHAAMMESYRDRSRDYVMVSTEKIWEKASAGDAAIPEGTPLWNTPTEKFIREMDRDASYFMF